MELTLASLYIHIPFCSHICSYCDFTKTSLWDETHFFRYLRSLEKIFDSWSYEKDYSFSTVYLGGGTPGLWGEEYASFMAKISCQGERTLEANPLDVHPLKVQAWKAMGINRISLGIQTLDPKGLDVLKRRHDLDQVEQAISTLQEHWGSLENVNADLIYGWPGQTLDSWRRDITQLVDWGIGHLSLYELTYESRTPLGRQAHRGMIPGAGLHEGDGEPKVRAFEEARLFLKDRGWIHEEVSHWARPQSLCQHNWAYWELGEVWGLGLGAWGYSPPREDFWGLRYRYPLSWKGWYSLSPHTIPGLEPSTLKEYGSRSSWLMEKVACSLRTCRGVPMKEIERTIQSSFRPEKRPQLLWAQEQSLWKIENGYLHFEPQEWVREQAWSQEVLLAFE